MFHLYSASESVSESTTTLHLLFGSSTHSRAAAVCAAATLQLSNPLSRRNRQVRPPSHVPHVQPPLKCAHAPRVAPCELRSALGRLGYLCAGGAKAMFVAAADHSMLPGPH